MHQLCNVHDWNGANKYLLERWDKIEKPKIDKNPIWIWLTTKIQSALSFDDSLSSWAGDFLFCSNSIEFNKKGSFSEKNPCWQYLTENLWLDQIDRKQRCCGPHTAVR